MRRQPADLRSFAERYEASADVDLRSWQQNEQGRVYAVRCRIPVELWAPGPIRSIARDAMGAADTKVTVETKGKTAVIEGIASSTSTDWYGTEMTLACLEDMATQMSGRAAVAYVPSHWDCEWDNLLGYTVAAGVYPASVASPYDAGEQGYVLRSRAELDLAYEMSQELVDRLDRGMEIGQSIGGWFTEMRFLCDEDGSIQRMFVEKVELDHLAATRKPANPDGWIEKVLSALERGEKQARSVWPEGEQKPASVAVRAVTPRLRGLLERKELAEAVVGGAVETKHFELVYAARAMGTTVATVRAPEIVTPPAAPVARADEPEAAAAAPADPEKNSESPTTSANAPVEASTLSVPAVVAEAGSPADGRASAPDASTTNDQEVSMTPEEIALLAKSMGEAVVLGLAPKFDALSTSVGALAERQAAGAQPNPNPNPAAAAVDPRDKELEELRAGVKERDETIERLARAPQRRGQSAFSGGTSPEGKHEGPWERTIRVARGAGLLNLAEFMTPDVIRNVGLSGRSYPDVANPGDAKQAMWDDLRSFLNAAEEDGALDDYCALAR